MGNCEQKEEIILSDKEQVEFLNQIKLSLSDLEIYVDNLKKEDTHCKMARYIFVLNSINQINPYLEILETGRKCDTAVKELLIVVLNAIKENDRKKYNKSLWDLKNYFKI